MAGHYDGAERVKLIRSCRMSGSTPELRNAE
jgi:hypothetical protein